MLLVSLSYNQRDIQCSLFSAAEVPVISLETVLPVEVHEVVLVRLATTVVKQVTSLENVPKAEVDEAATTVASLVTSLVNALKPPWPHKDTIDI